MPHFLTCSATNQGGCLSGGNEGMGSRRGVLGAGGGALTSSRSTVLQECHDAPTAGHQGVRKTASRLAQRYYWAGMFRDDAKYIKRCEICQKFKGEQRWPAGSRGKRRSLWQCCVWTSWVELVPLKRAAATLLQGAFRERILSKFGIPS